MIRKVTIRRFKRFEDETFDFADRNVVLVGPNNTGKTTVLQAIAAWHLAFERWKQLNDFQRHGGAYPKAPVTRQTFYAVPLRSFDLLWRGRDYRGNMEIEIESARGWTISMEFHADSTEQVYVRPRRDATPDTVRDAELGVVFVPPMTGLSTDEPLYQPAKVEQLLGQGKPGDVLRNILAQASQDQATWDRLAASIRQLFVFDLLPPNATGADILAEYREIEGGPAYDIASAGSGFQQVLMLLAFLYTRPGSVLLLDEPDAHLHPFLQDAILSHLRRAAAETKSQLLAATHSEVIMQSAGLDEIYVLGVSPLRLGDKGEVKAAGNMLRHLDHADLVNAVAAPGILYCEDYTDLDVLREWARTLEHPAYELLTTKLFWKPLVSEAAPGVPGIRSQAHHEALELVQPELPALELVDGDALPDIQQSEITGEGYQRQRWRRYEIESYLVHPEALARFVEETVGEAADQHVADLRQHLTDNYPPAVLQDPLGEHAFLSATKARTQLLPPALNAAGLQGFPCTEYYRIAAVMKPEEIHPEVVEKLDAICRAFGVEPAAASDEN